MSVIFSCIFFTCFFLASDYVLQEKFMFKGCYFLLHCIHNLTVSILTLHNVLDVFSKPSTTEDTLHPIIIPMVYALHVYHVISYFSYLRIDDWYHHIFSMGVAVPLTLTFFKERSLLGMCFFFTTGLPGAINYWNLFLSKNNLLSKQKQQHINTIVQSWIRCPGITMTCGFILRQVLDENESLSRLPSGMVIFFILLWNGIYFQNIVL